MLAYLRPTTCRGPPYLSRDVKHGLVGGDREVLVAVQVGDTDGGSVAALCRRVRPSHLVLKEKVHSLPTQQQRQ